MSQARARTVQTVKYLNCLYKVCSGTYCSRSYCSVSSCKTRSYVKENRIISSASVDFQNPNQFSSTGKYSSGYTKDWPPRESRSDYDENSNDFNGGNSIGIQRNLDVGQSYDHNRYYQNKIPEHSSNRSYEEGRNVQSSYMMNSGTSKDDFGGGNDQYPGNNEIFSENQGNFNMGEDSLHLQSQYNVIGPSSGNASSNQQSSVGNNQTLVKTYINMINPQQQSNYQHYEMSFEAVVEGPLFCTIKDFDDFCKDGKLKEALEVMVLLAKKNISLDIPRYLFLMKACGESEALTDAKLVHNHLTRSVPYFDVSISNKILEMYSKCGSMEDAYKVFDKMPQRNLTSWDTMITWFAKNGHGEDAIEMFTEFKRIGLNPDHQMFHGVFTACSVLGDMREGLLHFESMTKTYNLVPSMDHYASVVDMLGSAGYLNEALEFIEKMSIKPSVEIWEIMMKQSRVHGDLELGDRYAEMVNLLDPSRLDRQSKEGLIPKTLSDIAKEKEKKKTSRDDILDLTRRVYEFRAGDKSHPDREKLYSQLRCLSQHMKEEGYVPETRFCLHDLDQESKEEALLSHSEKLALSQGLLTTPPRAPIRIIKNLRVCVDCHNALKIISNVVGRVIIARDAKRFHHFENGECSCGDYW